MMVYKTFEDKKPVMLFDMPEQRIYAYPYEGFRDELNERSQGILQDQHKQAQLHNHMVVFVRDNARKKFVLYSLDSPPHTFFF